MSRVPAEPPEPSAVDAAVARAAALDDYLAGFAADPAAGVSAAASGDAGMPAPDDVAGLVETMLLLRQAAAAAGAVQAASPRVQPRSVGRHAILRCAGEGGFATVWEGFDTVLRRKVAVKVRRPELLLSESARRRFVREAEIAARLVHPHIVTIFEVGEDAGCEFIAAEFCSGGSLAAWLDRHPGPLEPRTAARLVMELAGAVAHAHSAGVIHRDIKPANVLLGPASAGSEPILPADAGAPAGGCTVKLGDFGLGKVQQEDGLVDPLTQLTRTGTSIGTPAWMAPEQIDRSFGPVGPATDVHALGLLLHRLLTGRAARDAGTDAETYRQVLLEEPAPAEQVVRGVPRDLAAVASKCLAKQPRERYESSAALAADLDRWLTGRPTVARPLSPGLRAARWLWRRPLVAGLGLAVLGAVVVAGWIGVQRARDSRQLVEREDEIRRQKAVAELRRGFEALRAGNVAEAAGQLKATRAIDPLLADSLAGRWLLRRSHGEREILMGDDPLAAAVPPWTGPLPPRDLYAIALAPDGATAAVAAADGHVYLLRGLGGTPSLTSVQGHDEVNAVAFSRDGTALATAGQDGRLRWWSLGAEGLEPAGEALLDAGPLFAATFSPDGLAIATGGEDRVVRLVRRDAPEHPTELFRFPAPPRKSPEIESAVFVDDDRLAVACGDLIVIVDATGRGVIRELQRPFSGNRNAVLGGLVLSPDGSRLAACGTDNAAHVWELESGTIVCSLPAHPAWVQGCVFSSDGSRLATACRDGGVRIYDLSTGRQVNRLLGHVGRVWSIAWEPTGTLLTAGADGTVRRWDPDRGFDAAMVRELALPGDEIVDVVTGPAGGRHPAEPPLAGTGVAFTIDRQAGLGEVDLDEGRRRAVAVGAGARSWRVALDVEGRRLAVCDLGVAGVRVVSVGGSLDHVQKVELQAGVDPTEAIACWTPTGDLVVRSRDGSLVWCAADRARPRRLGTVDGVVHCLAAAPAGPPRVALVGDRAVIHPLPESAAGPVPAAPPLVLPVSIETTAVAWSPDAAVLVCGTRTGAVQFFDAATGRLLGGLSPHERMVAGLGFSPDGRILFSADRHAVRISDAATLTTLDELRHGIELRTMCLTFDATRLVLAGQAGEPGPEGGARLAVVDLNR